ncbi:hypothetical protein [Pseudanabaena sp. UWO310]|uniref:hypothetical protein n=1 Tax=Pseudanabaena sp. UWO310 TaxID=2480795 RepID=UPI001156D430|nr:hypothetical protein [Pseudanabaena sp. UWO310]TYQ30937.1 hypothetical protein PseudUWO310_06225 [Pseudanabaena sp. UWO310]
MLSNAFRRILIASGFAIATSFMAALSASAAPTTASSTTYFTGTVDPSCAVSTDFTGNTSGTANTYTKTAYAGSGAGGVLQLQASDTVAFNCNSDTVGVSAVVVTTPPTAPVNATLLAGVHTALVTSTVDGTQNTTQTGNGTATGSAWKTDTQGNIGATVQSTWNPTAGGQELLDGTYLANVAVTVTPN